VKEIGFGVIGCGVIAPWHIRGILNSQGARLVAVSDNREEKAKKLGEEHKVDWYNDYEKMLEREDLDVACLCTPSSLHPEQAIASARAGKHVLTEKPMAVTLEAADEMIKVCREEKVKLGGIFQRRVSELFLKVKKALEQGELGKIVMGDAYMKYYRSQEYYDSGDWRGTWEFDGGGCLMNQGIHIIDLLQWYLGPVDTVYGYAETLTRRIEVEDTAAAVLKFKNGAIGVIEGTTSIYPPTLPHRVEIHGDKGTIMIEGEGIKRWSIMGEKGEEVDKAEVDKVKEEEGTGKAITSPTDIGMEGHRRLITDMVEAIREDREPLIPGKEARKALEIILAIYKSAKAGKPIKLPIT
jgi:predicted dehydrogenase